MPDQLLSDVRRLTAAKLGLEVPDVGPDTSFFELGADSLALMGMTAELEERYGARVPVRELFSTADTPRALAERLAQLGAEYGVGLRRREERNGTATAAAWTGPGRSGRRRPSPPPRHRHPPPWTPGRRLRAGCSPCSGSS